MTVIKKTKNTKAERSRWICKCECGTIKITASGRLRRGSVKSCGQNECKPNFKNLTDRKFGSLTVIKISDKKGNRGAAYWECECVCGKIVTIMGASMSCGKTRSCGCLKYVKQYETIKKHAYTVHLWHANDREIINNLSYEQYIKIASMNCHYCGDIDIKKNTRTKNTIKLNGVDRKNNELFYDVKNSLPCCRDCNFMKRKTSYEYFILKIKKIYSNINSNLKDKIKFDQ